MAENKRESNRRPPYRSGGQDDCSSRPGFTLATPALQTVHARSGDPKVHSFAPRGVCDTISADGRGCAIGVGNVKAVTGDCGCGGGGGSRLLL